MDWQQTLRGKDWQAGSGATRDSISALVDASENALPRDYLAFLDFCNGGQGPLERHPLWLVIYEAEFVASSLNDSWLNDAFPGLVTIGSNGAGECIAFDFRVGGTAGIVYFDPVNSDLEESVVPLAPSFTQLLSLLKPRVA